MGRGRGGNITSGRALLMGKSTVPDGWEGMYTQGGRRLDYGELSDDGKDAVKAEKERLTRELRSKYQGKTVSQVIDGGKPIEILFTKNGIKDFLNKAMLVYSGRLLNREGIMNVGEVLSRSSYVPTESHATHHEEGRKDGRDLWYVYKARGRKSIYFSVSWSRSTGYELRSVSPDNPNTRKRKKD